MCSLWNNLTTDAYMDVGGRQRLEQVVEGTEKKMRKLLYVLPAFD